MSANSPSRVTLFAFQVGFGDCFLLRFHYADFLRHVLVDFGSFPKPAWAGQGFLRSTAECIRQCCNGKLDAVVLTHRHADHINGFATDGDAPGAVIAACDPDLVVQPWTEDPAARPDAIVPTAGSTEATAGVAKRSLERRRAFVATLDHMRCLADAIRGEAKLFEAHEPALAKELNFFGERNLTNDSAIRNLMAMGDHQRGKRSKYVYYGSDSGLAQILPGVDVTVLGPPTLEQAKSIRRQAQKDPSEFWQLLALAAERRNSAGEPLFPTAKRLAAADVPPHARWLVDRMRSLRGRDLLGIVRTLDDALNNTSVILLFKVGEKKLLFPGDAQIENWRFAFSQPGVLEELKDVSLYKVGHHGSLNATPQTLWRNFIHASAAENISRRLVTVLSTEVNVHGHAEKNTEVPRRTLVQELKAKSQFKTTQTIDKVAGACAEIPIEL